MTTTGDPATVDSSAGAASSADIDASVSVIVPMYNAARFVDAALASLAAQSRPADEVVVVDDGSTDGGAALVERWADRLPLLLVRQPGNRGLGLARARAIAESNGSLVALLDADDYLFPDHLDTMLRCYARHGGIVTANTLWWSAGRQVSTVAGDRRKAVPPPDRQRLAIFDRNFLHTISLFARADYDRAGGFADLRHMEDWDLWMRMVGGGVRVTMPSHPTALYRVHPGSLSAERGNLPTHLRVLPGYLDRVEPDQRRVLERTLRRRRARQQLLHGEKQAAAGALPAAVGSWVRAMLLDRSLRGGATGGDSSVLLQAAANLGTAGRVGRARRARTGTAGAGLRQA